MDDAIRETFARQGYIVVPDVLDKHQLDELNQVYDQHIFERDEMLSKAGTDQQNRFYIGDRDIRETKAESKYLEVAAASILARATALKQLNYLSIKAGFSLPKGSTHVELALIELKERGLDFNKFVKTGFGNVVKFLQK